jgi:hypothetical protein
MPLRSACRGNYAILHRNVEITRISTSLPVKKVP